MSEPSFAKADDEAMEGIVKLQNNNPSRSDHTLHLSDHAPLRLYSEKVQEVQRGDDIEGSVVERQLLGDGTDKAAVGVLSLADRIGKHIEGVVAAGDEAGVLGELHDAPSGSASDIQNTLPIERPGKAGDGVHHDRLLVVAGRVPKPPLVILGCILVSRLSDTIFDDFELRIGITARRVHCFTTSALALKEVD